MSPDDDEREDVAIDWEIVACPTCDVVWIDTLMEPAGRDDLYTTHPKCPCCGVRHRGGVSGFSSYEEARKIVLDKDVDVYQDCEFVDVGDDS